MPETTKKTLYLLDGHALVYKYFYGYDKAPLITSSGEDTSVAFGIGKLITNLLNFYPLTHIAVIFDPPTKSFRKIMYPEYKANRKKEDDMSLHIWQSFEMIQKWGIYTNSFEYYEADDIIGALAKRATADGIDTVIVSKDKDFAQLVNPHVRMLDLGKTIGSDSATYIDEEGVKEKFGVRPDQVLEYLALMGDTADNVPGIKGVGPGTASKLLTEYGSVEGIYANIAKLPKGAKAAFEKGKEQLPLWTTLVTIKTDMEVPVTMDDLKRPELMNDELLAYMQQKEFFSLIKSLT